MQDRISKSTTRNIEVKYINSKTIKRIGKDRIRKETDSVNPKWEKQERKGRRHWGCGGGRG